MRRAPIVEKKKKREEYLYRGNEKAIRELLRDRNETGVRRLAKREGKENDSSETTKGKRQSKS